MIFKYRKIVGSRGFAPDPTGEAHSAPPDPLADSGPPTNIKKAYTAENAYLHRKKKLVAWVISPTPHY